MQNKLAPILSRDHVLSRFTLTLEALGGFHSKFCFLPVTFLFLSQFSPRLVTFPNFLKFCS